MADGGAREIILANIHTVLNTLMSPNALYNIVVAKVTRDVKPLDQYTRKSEFPLLQIKAGTQDVDTDLTERTFDEMMHVMFVDIEGAVQARENQSTELNRLIEDVVKLLSLDITRGGCATDTVFAGVTEVDELQLKNDAAVSFVVSYEIKYSTAEGDM